MFVQLSKVEDHEGDEEILREVRGREEERVRKSAYYESKKQERGREGRGPLTEEPRRESG